MATLDSPPKPVWRTVARHVRLRRVVLPWALAVVVVLWLHALTLQGMRQLLPGMAPTTTTAPATRPFITRTVRIDHAVPNVALTAPVPLAPKIQTSKQAAPAVHAALPPTGVPLVQAESQALAQVPTVPGDAPVHGMRTAAARAESGGPVGIQVSTAEAAAPSASGQTLGASQAPASAGTAAPPVYSYLVPGSTRLKYDVSGVVKGFKYHVAGELLWLQDGKTYDARLEVSHFLLGSRVQTSKGALTALGLEPLRFGDKVRSEVAAHFQRAKGVVSFSANTPDVPLLPLAQDQLSVFAQLAAMWGGNPTRFTSGMQLPFQAVGPRSAESWMFVVGAMERLSVDGREMPATKLLRERSADYDVRVELWLAPELDHLPARIRLTQSNGDEIDMLWRKTEKP